MKVRTGESEIRICQLRTACRSRLPEVSAAVKADTAPRSPPSTGFSHWSVPRNQGFSLANSDLLELSRVNFMDGAASVDVGVFDSAVLKTPPLSL